MLLLGGIFFGTMPDSAALWTCYLHLHQELRNAQVNRDEARASNRGKEGEQARRKKDARGKKREKKKQEEDRNKKQEEQQEKKKNQSDWQ